MLASRAPCPALRPYVRLVWAGAVAAVPPAAACREHVLPTGCMHLALRLGGPPLRLFDGAEDTEGRSLGHAVVGGARAGYYVREAGTPGWSVGAQLEPGAAAVLFGAGADALAECHTSLHALWGRDCALLLERLEEAADPRRCLALLEGELLARLAPRHAMHPGVAAALAALRAGTSVDQAVRASGLSHRHLVLRFRAATGLAPKQHARVLRLQAALEQLVATGAGTAALAVDAGYADQSHFNREFRIFAGLTPGQWRSARPAHPHHVPVPAGQ